MPTTAARRSPPHRSTSKAAVGVISVSPLGATSPGPSPRRPGTVKVTPMRSILLVDDDADLRLALRDFLTAEKFVVHTARDGQHALHVLDKIDPPNLILLDYKMPIMDGKQFLSTMRREKLLAVHDGHLVVEQDQVGRVN